MNNMATRKVLVGLNSMLSGNIFGGTFNISVLKQSMKNPHLLEKKLRRTAYDFESQ